MIQKRFTLALHFIFIIFLTGCYVDPEPLDNQEVKEGYRPVYGSVDKGEISFTQSRSVDNPGKIYVYDKYLLVNERKKGIHVFDNSNPTNPVNLGFIQMLGNTDMAIKDGVLYADHLGNLVALTVNDFNNIQEQGRLLIRNWHLGVPPPAGYYFECIDQSKGIVISWQKSESKNFKCYALQ